jgi:hypothetical protein
VIFAPGGFLGVSDEINAGDVMMVAEFAATHAGEERLRAVGPGG